LDVVCLSLVEFIFLKFNCATASKLNTKFWTNKVLTRQTHHILNFNQLPASEPSNTQASSHFPPSAMRATRSAASKKQPIDKINQIKPTLNEINPTDHGDGTPGITGEQIVDKASNEIPDDSLEHQTTHVVQSMRPNLEDALAT
jgi:hypothetical protein